MSKKEGFVMIRVKQVLITSVKMKIISETNILPIKYNKKQTTNQESMKIDNHDVCEIIEEVHRKNKFDNEFDIGWISECEYD